MRISGVVCTRTVEAGLHCAIHVPEQGREGFDVFRELIKKTIPLELKFIRGQISRNRLGAGYHAWAPVDSGSHRR